MKRQLWLGLALAAAAAGCRHETIEPMPGVMLSPGVLLRTERVRLDPSLELRRYELLASDVSNDFYPFNIPRAKAVDRLLSKLFVRQGGDWRFLDYVTMPRPRAGVSPDGGRIIYEKPDVHITEGDWPPAYAHDRRARRVAIRHVPTDQRFVLDCYGEVSGLGQASHWRPDGMQVAFTTTCFSSKPFSRQLVVLDLCGKVLLDGSKVKDLLGLEFIAYSPDGRRIAALRPADPAGDGRQGGTLVEVDVEARAVRDVAEVPAAVACKHVGRFERLVTWDSDGHCTLKQ